VLATVLDTRQLAAPDRFAAFNEAAAASVAPTMNRSAHQDDFRAIVQAADLGPVQLSTLTIPSVTARRTPALIRRSDPEMYHAALVTAGRHCLEHAGRQGSAGRGDLMLYDTSQPYAVHPHGDGGPAACIIVQVPRTALTLGPRQIAPLLAAPLSGAAGIGGLLAQFLTGLVTTADTLRQADALNLGTVLTDLVAALAAHELDLRQPVLPPPSRQVLLLRIRAYIQAQLSDPELGPTQIAAARHISVRYLHKLFEDQDTTVSAWIRGQRLTQARRDLTDPALCDQPVHVIAARWGFGHASQFSRAFRAAYGYPPSECRPRHRP
jgi:AraC-like DNA-binding protein